MTEELYINGTLMDIENVDIVRKYISPFFRDVNILRNNGSYTVKLPPTATNLKALGLSDRLDMFSDIPYQVNAANYYYDCFPVFENADCILIGVAEDGFIEVQFTWGLSKSKYLPLFEKKLNEIVPNGTTILESDWVVEWKKSKVVYNTGKKYRYLDYVSGERESDVRIIDGEAQPMAQAPEPFKSNLKEMTMHPFVEFSDMLDLIVNDSTNLASNVFDALKPRLTNKGLILGGNKGDKTIQCTIPYVSETEFVEHLYTNTEGASVAYYQIPLTLFSSSFIINPSEDSFYWDNFVLGNMNDELEVHINLTTLSNYTRDLKLYSRQISIVDGVGRSEIIEIQELAYTYVDPPGGYNYKRTYDTIVKLKKEVGIEYFIGGRGSFSGTIFIKAGGELKITHTTKESMFSLKVISPTINPGHYNCLLNLPEMTFAEFIQQMLIMTGMFIGYDKNGDIRFISFDKLKGKVQSGTAYNRSGRIGEITKNEYRFENFAQRNIIKFNNSDDVGYAAQGELTVNDLTLEKERDMYVIKFDLAEQSADGKAEFILYKQRVTENEKGGEIEKGFENNYSEKPSVCVYDSNGIAKYNNVCPNNVSENNVTFSMAVTKINNTKFEFTTPTPGEPIPEVGSRIYFRNPFGSGLVLRSYITSKTGNLFTISYHPLILDVTSFIFDNSSIGFISQYYGVMQKIIERPRVIECEDNMDVITSANIDYEKPFYADELGGRYAVLLELQAPNNEPCVAKLLLINQKL